MIAEHHIKCCISNWILINSDSCLHIRNSNCSGERPAISDVTGTRQSPVPFHLCICLAVRIKLASTKNLFKALIRENLVVAKNHFVIITIAVNAKYSADTP